jgi:tripartite-type tricarboxylate transporter receptor subunit TctC
VRAGKLRALAVLTSERTPLMPDVPTAREQGFTGLEFPAWIGVFAPAGLPADVKDRLAKAVATIASMPDTKERFMQAGLMPDLIQGDDFAREILANQQVVEEIARAANVPIQ